MAASETFEKQEGDKYIKWKMETRQNRRLWVNTPGLGMTSLFNLWSYTENYILHNVLIYASET